MQAVDNDVHGVVEALACLPWLTSFSLSLHLSDPCLSDKHAVVLAQAVAQLTALTRLVLQPLACTVMGELCVVPPCTAFTRSPMCSSVLHA